MISVLETVEKKHCSTKLERTGQNNWGTNTTNTVQQWLWECHSTQLWQTRTQMPSAHETSAQIPLLLLCHFSARRTSVIVNKARGSVMLHGCQSWQGGVNLNRLVPSPNSSLLPVSASQPWHSVLQSVSSQCKCCCSGREGAMISVNIGRKEQDNFFNNILIIETQSLLYLDNLTGVHVI